MERWRHRRAWWTETWVSDDRLTCEDDPPADSRAEATPPRRRRPLRPSIAGMDAEAQRTCSERRAGGPERRSGDVAGAPPTHETPVATFRFGPRPGVSIGSDRHRAGSTRFCIRAAQTNPAPSVPENTATTSTAIASGCGHAGSVVRSASRRHGRADRDADEIPRRRLDRLPRPLEAAQHLLDLAATVGEAVAVDEQGGEATAAQLGE